ncbi:C-type lectin domain family 4 member E-like [Trichomycterus rosablanca]|uniref:C-type lectin domain family 4 member E-like n=1 Tax=Trichomycterus rosablanca TaxID=2290929 RepID=UPI002F3509F0
MENIYSNTDVEFSNMNKEEKCSDFADFSQSVSLDRVSEQYTNATALLKMHENETTDEDVYENAIELKEDPKRQKSADHNQSASFDKLSERFANATAELKLQELKTTAKEREYKQLEEKHQRIHEVLSKGMDTVFPLSLFLNTANKTCELCDEGWRSPGLKCYFFSTSNLNWMASRDSCVEKGGHLVIITSQAEQDFLYLNVKETHWMGLNDLETEGKWMWVNNKTLDETGVKFWFETDPSEPDNWTVEDPSGENCASLGDEKGNYHRWFDASCQKVKKYICEK